MLFVLPAVAAQSATVELYRGATLGDPGYWAVEDAYLDKAEANVDHGGGFTLLGGDNRTVLIRFADLLRVVGPNRRVVGATLVLTPSGGDVPALKSATAVDLPWGEGPLSTITKLLSTIEAGPDKAKPKAARGAATWNERRVGIAGWPSPGTPSGASVAATGTAKDRTFEIGGLGPAVQGWLDRPWTNHGLALSFGGDVEFFSSQSPSGRPKLILTTEPVATIDVARPDLAVLSIAKADGRWTARVKNVGAAPAPSGKATWWTDGKAGPEAALGKALGPGEETTVAYAGNDPASDPQFPTLGFAVTMAGDASTPNDRLDVFPGAKPVTLRVKPGFDPLAAVEYWNETVAPQSRFSFAPEGAKTRVRLEGIETAEDGAATLRDALRQIGRTLTLPVPPPTPGSEDLYPGLMGYGDTRFEGSIPGKLPLPYEPYPDPATETALLEPTGLLSGTDVGRLNDGSSSIPMPRLVMLRVLDLVGRPLANLDVTVEGPGVTPFKIKTLSGGIVILPNRGPDGPFGTLNPSLANGTLTLRASQQGVAATTVVKAWRVSDAFRRSTSTTVIVDVRMDLPSVPLETGTDLAHDRAATDSLGTDPAKLAGATDADEASAAPLGDKPGSWIDVDLGRDRTLGEIAIRPGEGSFWKRFEIRVYSTGQKPEDALIWAGELDSDWTRRNRAEGGWLTYRAPVQRIRFIRIVSLSGGPASLAGLRAVPVKLQQ